MAQEDFFCNAQPQQPQRRMPNIHHHHHIIITPPTSQSQKHIVVIVISLPVAPHILVEAQGIEEVGHHYIQHTGYIVEEKLFPDVLDACRAPIIEEMEEVTGLGLLVQLFKRVILFFYFILFFCFALSRCLIRQHRGFRCRDQIMVRTVCYYLLAADNIFRSGTHWMHGTTLHSCRGSFSYSLGFHTRVHHGVKIKGAACLAQQTKRRPSNQSFPEICNKYSFPFVSI
mmetsp:Transcript_36415/g.63509  ORF Transcript_36415/g.63509 Transcript_36415/m.63509 type:complete len:228 (-) Transcript_36415:1394-2077(-)